MICWLYLSVLNLSYYTLPIMAFTAGSDSFLKQFMMDFSSIIQFW